MQLILREFCVKISTEAAVGVKRMESVDKIFIERMEDINRIPLERYWLPGSTAAPSLLKVLSAWLFNSERL